MAAVVEVAAAAQIQSVVWELPYATGAARKKSKEKKSFVGRQLVRV